jgi:glutathione S-transferase
MLKFFFGPNSCALASHIALEEAGAEYEAVRLDLVAGDQRKPDYLKVNPKGRVPALMTDRGVLTETPAILAYIAQAHPDKNLAPCGDAYAFAQIQSFNSYLCSTVHVAHAHRTRGHRWADEQSSFDDMKRKVPETVSACFELIEREMLAGPWVSTAGYSIADPYLFTLSGWMEADGVDPRRFPRVLDHRQRMAERPAVKRVLPHHR